MKNPYPLLRPSPLFATPRSLGRRWRGLGFALSLAGFPLAASAFTNVPNVFAGSNGSNPVAVSASATVLAGASQTLTIGPGFSATSTVPLGVIYTQSVEINDPTNSPGGLRVSGSGVVGISSTFSSTRTFTGNALADFSTYEFALTKDAASSIGLLSQLRVVLKIGTTTVFDTAAQSSSLLSQFSTSDRASYFFTTSDVDNLTPFTWIISGTSLATLLNNSMRFSGGSLMAVPEGSTVFLLAAGAALLGLFRRSRPAGRR